MNYQKGSRTKSLSLSEDLPSQLINKCRISPLAAPPMTMTTTTTITTIPGLTTVATNLPVTPLSTPLLNSIKINNNNNNNNNISHHYLYNSSISQQIINNNNKKIEDVGKILKYIDENVIGKGVAFLGPFGRRKVVYADYDSSGRSLQFLEDYINREILPAFGDSTCTSAVTGLQSKLYCNEAKEIIRLAVNASDDDTIFFTQGSTVSLSEKICSILCSTTNNSLNESTNNSGSPILFVSSSETIGNIIPWLNAGAEVIRVNKTREGFLDLVDLEKKLVEFENSRRLLIGYFTGASRLTGILADHVATTILLHQYGAVSVWDFSLAGSYAPLDMNPQFPGAAKDIMCFNTNKFIGGVQGPGVVVIKKSLFSIVTNNQIEPFDNIGMVEYVRAGLVMQLKESIGVQNIAHKQEKLCKMILAHIRTIPEIILIGPLQMTAKRVPILCFLVKHPRGSFLHHKFVVAVLNDVFGIQVTAGCHIGDALGISNKLSVDFERVLSDETCSNELIRPGYTKLLFPYFMSEPEVGYILEALKMVATEAWKLLPQYEVDDITGEWRHHSNSLAKERKWLSTIRYNDGRMQFTDRRISGPGTFPQNYSDSLQTARNLFNRSRKMAQKSMTPFLELKLKRDSAEKLRWFMLPGEAHELLLGHSQNVKNTVPFNPNKNNISEFPSLMFRHNSLSALDVKRFKSRSLPTSPIKIPYARQRTAPVRYSECIFNSSPPVVRFSLGGELSTSGPFDKPVVNNCINHNNNNNNEETTLARNRCHSWSATSTCSPISVSPRSMLKQTTEKTSLSLDREQTTNTTKQAVNKVPSECITAMTCCTASQTAFITPLKTTLKKPILCSCSSQTDLLNPDLLTPFSLRNSAKCASSISSDSDDIKAYVAEKTKELATELTSGIREVISQVEDVLDNTESGIDISLLNLSSMQISNTADESRSDSVSVNDVTEYLEECSRKMANEVTSEIREAVNDITLFSIQKKSLSESEDDTQEKYRLAKQRFSDSVARTKKHSTQHEHDAEKMRSESFPRPQSTPAWHHPSTTAQSLESSTPNCPYTGAISKLVDPLNTSSQDSGINMCFPEHDESRIRTLSDSLNDSRKKVISRLSLNNNSTQSSIVELSDDTIDSASASTSTASINSPTNVPKKCDCVKLVLNSSPISIKSPLPPPSNLSPVLRNSADVSGDLHEPHLWQHLPRDAWKQTAEAIDEFNMLKDGDRVLVCLSGSSASLCLLHALRQFSRARGLHIEMSAITVGKCGVDPRALMLYLRDINIELFIENLAPSENYISKVYATARRKHFTVLAMGNSLDKLAEDFLMSVLYKGKLYTPQAHSTNRDGDLRIIRPFVYVREKLLEDFTVQKMLPTRPSRTFCKPLDASNSILKVQEVVYPGVYDNIKSAIRPLLSARIETNKSIYEFRKLSLISRN